MGSYAPATGEDRKTMMDAVGISSIGELYKNIPSDLMIERLKLPKGMSEIEVSRKMREMAAKNKRYSSIFRGAGAYNHYIPAIVKSVAGKEEFVTSYTPYQAEISQGVLQSIFEYQTMICELTGMEVSNASVYDGASAAAEAMAMCRDQKRKKILISAAAHPMVISTVKTYAFGVSAEVVSAPAKDGKTDMGFVKENLDAGCACLYIQQPNFFGMIEDAESCAELAHEKGVKLVMGVNPIAAAILRSAGECGADIAVGDGQPLGMPLGFGGPYLGFMATGLSMVRKLPGRIVGETKDMDGNRAFVLTLQAREQHIRREKASSNICTNQALCALTANAYVSAMGPSGLRAVADQCYSKAHYAAEKISGIPGFGVRYGGEFFHEFVTETPEAPDKLLAALDERGILGGYPVDGGLLWCFTEMNSMEQIDALCVALREVCAL